MNPFQLWFGIFALLGVVMVAPAWVFFAGPFLSGLPTVVQWLGAAVLPLTLLMMIASWLKPGGS
jgi:hypothetical protein